MRRLPFDTARRRIYRRSMIRRKLPTGIQTFRELREDACYYVDKTRFAERMVTAGKQYFLSRPRRFGKSLFLDTLKELFEGNRKLFEGLHIHDRWDWSVRYPVVRLDFSGSAYESEGKLGPNLNRQMSRNKRMAGLAARHEAPTERFGDLIERLHRRTGQRVVVLVDEYDKPILDALENPTLARTCRGTLRGLYGNIKDCDAHIRFVFLTGVSKFSKVSLFLRWS